MPNAFTAWLRQGSTATGLMALMGTITHTATTGVQTDPWLTATGLIASLVLMLWPEKSSAIADIEQIVDTLLPIAEKLAPLVAKTGHDIAAPGKTVVVTTPTPAVITTPVVPATPAVTTPVA